ncbi:MAG: hypothetical protein M3342_18490 [Bacteroidota bacterium]|nr:PepSY-like domain-containing protein [Flavisolibacter sp.]MDQ3845974.1 hypothetical protein [Bacteroidota bacterium]MBD0295607.1 PepSY-like domain-containing protein [Flavisolibacter sp.]MBD0350789.1 PepSY-like domain-containing protein [Flavisolibacter sp.]MBD0366281.1 PepSY-like domain-containing protein [Flavisolibacter sp.]
MKKLLFAAATLVSLLSFATPPADINDKVLKAFKESFTHAQNVVWNEGNGYYDVSFKQNDIQTRVRYDKKGNFIESLRYYGEQQLPLNVLAKLKKQYAAKKVFGVTEMTTNSEVIYRIILEDAKTWLIIHADATGSIEEMEKYNKA